jgi:hypothetical protein
MDMVTKSPAERFPVHFNFSVDFIAGETIATETITCGSAATGASTKATIIDSESASGPEVTAVLKGGTEGDEHNIECVVETSKGNRYQRDLFLRIQSVVSDRFDKQPADAVMFDLDFSRRLETGDTLASVVAIATKESDGTDVSATMVPDPEVISPKAGIRARAGDDGETYLLAVQGTSAAGYIHEKFLRMNVQERP